MTIDSELAPPSLRSMANRAVPIAVLGAATLLFSGCGVFGSQPTPGESPSPSGTTKTSPAAPAQPGTITNGQIVDGRRSNHGELTAYIHTGNSSYHAMSDAACETMASDLANQKKVTRWIIAFATPTSNGTLKKPSLTDSCAKSIHDIAKDSHLSVAVAGSLASWQAAADNPAVFGQSASQVMQELSDKIDVPVTGLDIDWEFPTASQTKAYTKLVTGLRKVLPEASISMTVGCNINAKNVVTKSNPNFPGDFQASLEPKMVKSIDMIQMMAYARFPKDKSGRLDPNLYVAHHLAPTDWTEACVEHWSNEVGVGNTNKLVVGYPAYGMQYQGASDFGDSYSNREAVWLKNIDDGDITEAKPGYYKTVINGSITSIVPRSVMKSTQKSLLKSYPGLGGAMVWPAEGMDKAVIKALGS